MKEIAHQLEMGDEELAENDKFLLECNFDELATTNGQQQEYWILAIQAAREACRLAALVSTGHVTAAKVRYRRELRASLKIGPTSHMLGTTKCGLNNSQENKNLEGESPLSAVPTATLLCTHASGV